MKKHHLILITVLIIAAVSGGAVYASMTGGKTEDKKKKVTVVKTVEKNNTEQAVSTTISAVTKSAIETFPVSDEKDIGYIKAETVSLKDGITTASAVTIKLKKKSKVKIEEEKKDGAGKSWIKVSIKSGDKVSSGWTSSENVVKEYKDLLSEKYKMLDYNPYPKAINYPENPRQKVRGIYMTLYSASGERLNKLIDMTKRTKINAFVIDVKDDNGNMLFKTAAADKYVPNANK